MVFHYFKQSNRERKYYTLYVDVLVIKLVETLYQDLEYTSTQINYSFTDNEHVLCSSCKIFYPSTPSI